MIKVINDIIDVVLVSIIYIYIVNFEQITHCSSVSIIEFEQVNVDQVYFNMHALNGSNTSRRPVALQSKVLTSYEIFLIIAKSLLKWRVTVSGYLSFWRVAVTVTSKIH